MAGLSVGGESLVLDALKCFGISHLSVSKMEVFAGSMEGKLQVIICTLTANNQHISTHALSYCAATGIACIDEDFIHHHKIPSEALIDQWQVDVINGRPIDSGDITPHAKIGIEI